MAHDHPQNAPGTPNELIARARSLRDEAARAFAAEVEALADLRGMMMVAEPIVVPSKDGGFSLAARIRVVPR